MENKKIKNMNDCMDELLKTMNDLANGKISPQEANARNNRIEKIIAPFKKKLKKNTKEGNKERIPFFDGK